MPGSGITPPGSMITSPELNNSTWCLEPNREAVDMGLLSVWPWASHFPALCLTFLPNTSKPSEIICFLFSSFDLPHSKELDLPFFEIWGLLLAFRSLCCRSCSIFRWIFDVLVQKKMIFLSYSSTIFFHLFSPYGFIFHFLIVN